MLDHGIYHADTLRWWFGDVQAVSAFTSSFVLQGGTYFQRGNEETGAIIMKHRNEAISIITGSWAHPPFEFKTRLYPLEAHGDRGSVLSTSPPGIEPVQMERPIVVYHSEAKEPYYPELPKPEPELELFLKAFTRKERPPVTGKDGRAAVEIIEAAYKSAATGRQIELYA